MTRKCDEHVHHFSSDEQYEARHVAWPKSLAEQDVEWDRADRLREVQAARVAKRGRP